MDLEHRFDGQTLAGQQLGGAAGGDQGEAQLAQAAGHRQQGRFVAVVGRDKHGAAGGQGIAGGLLGLGVGHAKAPGAAHDLAGAAHLGTQQGVGAREALERQHRLFDRLQGGLGLGRQAQLGQGFASHHLAGHLGQGDAGGLGHKRHRARGAGVGLDDEHGLGAAGVTLHRKLQVDQASHVEGQGQVLAPLADRRQRLGAQADRRQAAGRIARVDAGRFDVLHQSADHHRAAGIAQGIDIHFGGVVEVLVDQHRMVGFDRHRLGHVAVEFGFGVDHLHGAAAQHVTGAHHHGVADRAGDG